MRPSDSPEPVTPEDLRLLLQRVARRIRAERGDETISDSQLSVLFNLELSGPLSPSALAAVEHISPPAMTRTINSLEQRGLVARERHEEDARRVAVILTPAGEEVVAATRRLRTEWFAQRLAGLSAQERAALDAAAPVLRRIVAGD